MKEMKHFLALAFFTLLAAASFSQNTDVQDLIADLAEAQTPKEKMVLQYEIAEAYLRSNASEAEAYGKRAYNAAVEQSNKSMAARAAYVVALAYERQRDDRNTDVWLRTALNYAKQIGDSDLIIRSVDKRSQLLTKDRNYREAYQIMQEAFNYFSQKGTSISDAEARFEALKGQIDREKRDLERERDQLEFQVRNLRVESDQLSNDKSRLEVRQSELLKANREKEEELVTKSEELASVSQEREQAEQKARQRATEIEALSEEAAKNELILQEKENDLMRTRLVAERQRTLVYAAVGIAGIVLLMALLFFSLFRAKRRTAKQLEDKNRIIETERQRSDDLLLNILPKPIADELKQNGTAKARKFEEVSVLFSDFQNFTRVAEQLTPEELVEELDKCFKAFDSIINQHKDIEKIKTIGDAYMCASGLSERKSVPASLVRAALAMQQFLDEQKEERRSMGKPYFEARIGIHTGPVVAGVVGVKKFAYDIWGDTVNIASRVEANGQVGRVNISETTYSLIKYDFDCEYRGKVEAKNKGLLDMYFVNRESVAAAVA
jgi:class 3 adenylate cyclase